MALEAVFLDLGDTLVTERTSRAAVYAAVARAHGLAVQEEELGPAMTRAHAALPQRLVDGSFRYSDGWFRAFQRQVFADFALPEARFEALSRDLFAAFEDARTFRLHDGARELVATLRARGLVVGLISNWSARLGPLLEALGLAQAFDVVLGSAELELEKPDPRLFRLALERARVAPERALHAGDRLDLDVEGARAAGLRAVLVDHAGRLDPARLPCPRVRTLRELQDRILSDLA